MTQLARAMFGDEERAKTTIAVGGSVIAAIGLAIVLAAVILFR